MNKDSGQAQSKSRHFFGIDWLRYLAALVVFLGHVRSFHWGSWNQIESSSTFGFLFFAVTRLGHEAVVVFFVLSGFLVGGRLVEKVLAGQFSHQKYWIDRATRIYIPLVPTWVISAIAMAYVGQDISVFQLVGNAFSLQGIVCTPFANNSPLWSLSYEVWFYVLAGSLAGITCGNRRSLLVYVMLLMLSLAAFMILDSRYLLFWGGGAIAFVIRGRILTVGWALFGSSLVCAGTVGAQLASTSSTAGMPRCSLPVFICWYGIAGGLALTLPWLVSVKPDTQAIKSFDRIGAKLAAPSYTLYLVHFPLLVIVNAIWKHERFTSFTFESVSLYLGKVAIISLLTFLVYYGFEAKTSRFRMKLYGYV